MKISRENIDDFQRLYEEQFGVKLDLEEATERGLQLIRLMELIYKPITKESIVNVSKCHE